MSAVTPYLQVTRTADAIAWYERVLGATEVRSRLVTPDGTCMNAQIEVEGARIMLADEMPGIGSKSPESLLGTSVVLNLEVADVDAVFRAAIDAGAEAVYPVSDQFYGQRTGRIRDPFGHHWILATTLREVSDADTLAAFNAMFSS